MSILKEYQEVLDELDGTSIQEELNERDKEIFEYQAFVQSQMKKNNIKSLSEMDLPQRARFFNECKELWEEMKAEDKTPSDLKMVTGEKPSTVLHHEEPKKLKERNLDELEQPGRRLKRWMGLEEGDADERNSMNENWTKKQRKNPKTIKENKNDFSEKVTESKESRKLDRKIAEIEALLEKDRSERNSRRSDRIDEDEDMSEFIGKTVSNISFNGGMWTVTTTDGKKITAKSTSPNPPDDEKLAKLNKRFAKKTLKKVRMRQGVLTLGLEDGGIERFGGNVK